MSASHRHALSLRQSYLHQNPLRAILYRSTYARHRIRHGIRHTQALAGRCHRPYVSNERLRCMRIGYARVSKTDGSHSLDLQCDALRAAGIDEAGNIYHDFPSSVHDRSRLDSCLRALRKGDVPVGWKLDRLGRNLAHLVKPCRSSPPEAWACGCSPVKARRSTPPPRPAGPCSASSRRWPSSSVR